jgi:23S rRNA (uracil1939-C5)-methyltransferase
MVRRRKPAPPPRELTATAKALGARGDAVFEGPVYAPGVLPGEAARLEVRGERGRVLERLTDSPDRVAPPCSVADRCGGCAVQHFDLEAYRRWKRGLAAEALTRAGIKADLADLVDASGEGRRRMTFHALKLGAHTVFGLSERAGDRIVELADCPVAVADIRENLPALRQLAQHAAPKKGRLDIAVAALEPGLDIAVRGAGKLDLPLREFIASTAAAKGWARVTVDGEPVIEISPPEVRFGDVPVTPPPGGFLQATKAGEEALADVVLRAAEGAKSIVDLFAGSGAFALRLARRAHVLAVEGEAGPLNALKRAAERTPGLKPVDAGVRDLALEPLGPKELEGADLVVIDPPRSGAKAQAERLADSLVPTVCSISCNPATFARDAAILIEGGYKIDGPILPVDQFKWTGHVELAAVFRR